MLSWENNQHWVKVSQKVLAHEPCLVCLKYLGVQAPKSAQISCSVGGNFKSWLKTNNVHKIISVRGGVWDLL